MTDTPPRLRINRLKIENYKKIDHLEIEFPLPLMEGDPDIFVLGSKNGGGKTSVLECCALTVVMGILANEYNVSTLTDNTYSLVRSGENISQLHANFDIKENNAFPLSVDLEINRSKGFRHPIFSGSHDYLEILRYYFHQTKASLGFDGHPLSHIFTSSSEPLIIPPLLYFNGYRKTSVTNPTIGMITSDHGSNSDINIVILFDL